MNILIYVTSISLVKFWAGTDEEACYAIACSLTFLWCCLWRQSTSTNCRETSLCWTSLVMLLQLTYYRFPHFVICDIYVICFWFIVLLAHGLWIFLLTNCFMYHWILGLLVDNLCLCSCALAYVLGDTSVATVASHNMTECYGLPSGSHGSAVGSTQNQIFI